MSEALLRQALDALEYHRAQTRPILRTEETIEALRAALQRPAADPVAIMLRIATRLEEMGRPQAANGVRLAILDFEKAVSEGGAKLEPIATVCIYPRGMPATHELAWLGPLPLHRPIAYDLYLAPGTCGQVCDGVVCPTKRVGNERLCPDCNPRKPA